MTKITVRTDGGKVRIRLGDEARAPVATEPTEGEATKTPELSTLNKKAVLLSDRLINLMEIRTESSFRPKEEDVEIVYALSGRHPNMPDMLHKLSSHTVVEEATPNHITSSVAGVIEHIRKERGYDPRLAVMMHTHPRSQPRPSGADKRYFESASGTIKALIPGAKVLFGVHAVSSESIRERQEPAKIARNTIKWSSITREHEVSFYTWDAKPYEVDIID